MCYIPPSPLPPPTSFLLLSSKLFPLRLFVLIAKPSVYRLVLETLNPLPQDRKCFRMINGVLVQRTVKDVKPVLETNTEGLKKVLDDLVKQYKQQQEEMEKWKVCGFVLSLLHLLIFWMKWHSPRRLGRRNFLLIKAGYLEDE